MPRGGARPGAGRKKKVVAPPDLNAPPVEITRNRGNAGKGRPFGVPNHATATLKAYAGQYTIEAVDGLVALARLKRTPAAAKVSAWREVLDRSHGKPKEFHDIHHVSQLDLSKLSGEELALVEQMLAKAAPDAEATVH